MKDFIVWEPTFDVGIEIVDKQHKHLVQLMNGLYNACLGDKYELDEKFREVMKELVEYVMIHFKDEERLMDGIKYPKIQDHKQKHEDFVKEVLGAVNDYAHGKHFVPNNFVRFLRDWLFDHILIHDKEMAKYYFSLVK